jgi:acetylornithine/N-succinyldiaminopimelate aminotransferase
MTISPLMPVYGRCEVAPVRGDGCYLYDAQGREWLDMASGIAVNCLGHGHPHLVQAIQSQAATLMHTSNLYKVPAQEHLAQRLVDLTFADTVFFTNSGAEAIECAVKTAFSHHYAAGNPHKHRIITFSNAFHGRTLATIAATDQEKLRKGFEPLPDWFKVVPFDDLAAAEAAIDDTVGAFMVEPIQGEGGIRPASEEFIKGLRALADEHDLMLVLDEVQCGVARTGTFYAYEHYGIEPDILATAKGIGGGFPLGACIATEKAARGMTFGTHGSTYGGNPLAMAAGMAVMQAVANEEFLASVREKGERLRAGLEQFIGNYPDMFELVRGKGLMLGLKMKFESRPFYVHLRDNHHLLTVAAGDNTIRILPPLVIGDAEIEEFFDKLSAGAASFKIPEAA